MGLVDVVDVVVERLVMEMAWDSEPWYHSVRFILDMLDVESGVTFCLCCAAMAVLMSRFSSCTEMLSKRCSRFVISAIVSTLLVMNV